MEYAICSGCCRDEFPPDRVTLRPEILALVVKAFNLFVDDDAERHAVQPRNDAAVEFRRARVQRYGVTTTRVAHRLGALRREAASTSGPDCAGVPRMMKLSAASPQYSFSHGIFASKPPAATTSAFAATSYGAPL